MANGYIEALKEFFGPLLGLGMVFLIILVTEVIPMNAIADWGKQQWGLSGGIVIGLLYMIVWFAVVVCVIKWLENH